jgi:hypothetical protein
MVVSEEKNTPFLEALHAENVFLSDSLSEQQSGGSSR